MRTTAPSEIAAVVLAGGRGTRLGGPAKVALQVAGTPLLTTVVTAATGAGATPVVVMGPPRPDLVPGAARAAVRFVPDRAADAGPAAALATGTHALGADGAQVRLLLAADLPFVTARHLRSIVAALRDAAPEVAGIVPIDPRGREQWLLSAWRTAPLRERLDACGPLTGSSLHRVLAPLTTVSWQPPGPTEGGLAPWFDCDTPEQLAEAAAASADHRSQN